MLERFRHRFPRQRIDCLTADREFRGHHWLAYLLKHGIPFRIPIPNTPPAGLWNTAHLIRRFEAIARRVGQAGAIGEYLLVLARSVIRTRHRWEQGQLTLYQYEQRMNRLRESLRQGLESAQGLDNAKRTVNQCAHVLKDESLYWTFLSDSRIPLTNNCAERTIRAYVLWRKVSFFSQSYRGDQYRPMILSIVETAKRLNISTSRLLRAICAQGLRGEPISVRLPLVGCPNSNSTTGAYTSFLR